MAEVIRAVFLDLDGVILDVTRTRSEWERLVGDYFAGAVGGEATAWGLANRTVFPRVFAAHVQQEDDPLRSEIAYGLDWVRALCREVGAPQPSRSAALRHWREAEVHVCANTTAAFPSASAAIRALRRGYSVHTASGNFSWRVDALLAQLGVLDHFEVRFGPDRAGAAKHTAHFYDRAFAAAGVRSEQALVVDDDPRQLEIAAALGARTALITAAPSDASFDLVLTSIEALPGALAGLRST